jgi:hypothetical protein
LNLVRALIHGSFALAIAAASLGALEPRLAAAASGPNLYVLTAANSIALVSATAPAAPLAPLAVSGLAAGETLAAIDVRPQNGRLYGLASDGAGALQLYHIDLASGAAVATSVGGGPVQFSDGVNPILIAGDGIGMDFNPSVDRIRIVTSSGLNGRMNPNTGTLVDGDNGGAAGSVAGVNPDGAIKGATTSVDDTAYTNSSSNVTLTTQYTLDSATDSLFIQNPPNSGTQTAALPVTLDGDELDFGSSSGFDISSTVAVTTANAPAVGTAYAALTVDGDAGLYLLNLGSGAATSLGALGDLDVRDLALVSTPAAGIALGADGAQLLRFLVGQPATVLAAPVTGIAAGEVLVGIDGRPATGQLFGVGVNEAANNGTLYRIDPQTGAATAIGTPGVIAFVDVAGAPIDLPPASAGYGVDFNPTVDRIRLVSASGLNARLNPLTGAPVDGDLGGAAGSVTGTNPDGPVSGGASSVDATAYTNNFQGVTGQVRTTQYTLDAASNTLFIQNPPNAGVQTMPMTVTLNGAALDFTAASGFDIPPGVTVATANAPATGKGYAALAVGGATSLYSIDLASGAATLVGPVGAGTAGVGGLVVWSMPLRYGLYLPIAAR